MIDALLSFAPVPGLPPTPGLLEQPAEVITASEQALTDLGHLASMMIVAVWALLLLISDAFAGPGMRQYQRRIALVGVGLAALATLSQFGQAEYDAGVPVFAGFLVVDHFAMLIDLAILAIVAAVIGYSGDYARSHRFEYGEQESLVLMAAFGMMILAHSENLLALFIGIETMSIAVYVLVGARWNKRESSEAAFKYFVMGAFSSGILLMGLALLYGGTGTTDLSALHTQIQAALNQWGGVQGEVQHIGEVQGAALATFSSNAAIGIAPIMLIIPGILLTLGALLFKISAVPFHMWTPDAYDGAPTPITGFMAAGVKLAAFSVVLKLFVGTLYIARLVEYPYGWSSVVGVLALLTMTVGNLAAVRQTNVKRLLAYSSIAHVGYLLIGVIAAASFYGSATGHSDKASWALGAGDQAVASVLFYLVTYAVATLGAFACVAWLSSSKKEATGAHEWSGLATRHPAMALAMTICLLSLMGMPPTAGFVGKLFVFKAGLENTNMLLRVLVVGALINSVIGAYYYLRLVVNMYFRAPLADSVTPLPGRGAPTVAALAAAGAMVMGIGADAVMKRCELATAGFIEPPGYDKRAAIVDQLRAKWEAEDEAAAAKDQPGASGQAPPAGEPVAKAQPTPLAPPAGGDEPVVAAAVKPEE